MNAFITAFLLAVGPTPADIDGVMPTVEPLYRSLHQHPELSKHETQTAKTLGAKLKALGFTVTTGVGGTGFFGVLQNGPGPTVLIRTELDALPVDEKTKAPYQSQVPGVMHACGHDLHMATWVGTATLLSTHRAWWKGTLLFVGQPAEEDGDGAKTMVADAFFERAPKPQVAIALHDSAEVAAGQVGITSGYALANVDTVTVTVYGRGGHGAYPHRTIDPIVTASKIVLGVQTIVSRETNPLEPAVVTVGSFHAGTRPNVIPDEATLQLTLRSYSPETRQALRDGVARVAQAEATAARMTKPPLVKVEPGPAAVFNDVALSARLEAVLVAGGLPVVKRERVMGAEDFGEFGLAGGFPSVMLWLGAVEPSRFEAAEKGGDPVPSLHSAQFLPDKDRALRTGVLALTTAALELLAH